MISLASLFLFSHMFIKKYLDIILVVENSGERVCDDLRHVTPYYTNSPQYITDHTKSISIELTLHPCCCTGLYFFVLYILALLKHLEIQ